MLTGELTGVSFHHDDRTFTYVQRKGRGFSRNDIHVDGDQNTCCCDLSRVVVAHLMAHADRFISDFQHGRANGDRVARAQFTFVLDVLFNGRHSTSFLATA
jgi:hypothetical protein